MEKSQCETSREHLVFSSKPVPMVHSGEATSANYASCSGNTRLWNVSDLQPLYEECAHA